MGEALGIDLRAAACAAARWRDGQIEPCVLGDGGATPVELIAAGTAAPSADLIAGGAAGAADVVVAEPPPDVAAGTSPEVDLVEPIAAAASGPSSDVDAVGAARAALVAVAAKALHRAGEEAVGVAYALTPDDGPRRVAELAMATAFGPVFLVPRPVAAVARLVHDGGPAAGDVAVLDVDGHDVDVALVRSGRDGFDVVATSRLVAPPGETIDVAAHLDRAVSELEAVLAEAGVGVGDVRAVVAVGGREWLDQLAVQVRVATGLTVTVDPEPELAAAIGAALLAGGPERRGRTRVAGAAAGPRSGPATVGPAAPLLPTGPDAGSEPAPGVVGSSPAAGPAVVGTAGAPAGSGNGARLHDTTSPTDDGLPDAAGAAGAAGLRDAAGTATGADADAGRATGDANLPDAAGDARGADMPDAAGDAGGVGWPDATVGTSGGGGRAGGRRRVAAAAGAAAAALLVLGGAVVATGGSGGGGSDVEAGSGRGGATTSTRRGVDGRTSPEAPAATVPGSPVTTLAGGTRPGDLAPGSRTGTTVAGSAAPTGPGAPGPSGGIVPTTLSGPGDPSPTTTPTTPPDTTGPSVSDLSRSPGSVYEQGAGLCEAPFTSALSATITDPSGVTSAAVTWVGNGTSGAVAMTASGTTWHATLGPVDQSEALGYGQTADLTWTVTALDAAGNATSVPGPTITVQGC